MTPAQPRPGLRVSWLDLGRVLAMFAVIGIHYASPDFHAIENAPDASWFLGAFWMAFLKGEASTLFFMISGALLLPRSAAADPIKSLKRVVNLAGPLLVWSLLILGYHTVVHHAPFHPWEILYKPAFYHLWFLYAMIGVYVFLPFIKAVYDRIVSCNTFKAYFFVLCAAVFFVNSYGESRAIPVFGLEAFFGYGLLFLLGGVTYDTIVRFGTSAADKRKIRLWAIPLFVVLKVLTFMLLYRENLGLVEATEHWVRNFQFHIVATSVVFLALLSTIEIRSERTAAALSWLSNKVFVIYFLHALILQWVKTLIAVPQSASVPLYTLLNFTLCLAFAIVVRRSLPTRKILG